MLKKSLVLTSLTFSLLFFGCSDSTQEEESMVAKTSFELTSTQSQKFTITKEGNEFSLTPKSSKIIIYDIFATWCPPCRAEAPHLASLQKKFPDDLLVLGITIEDDKTNADLEAFKKEYGANYTILNSKDNKALASAMASVVGEGPRFGIPLMIMMKDGKYITHYSGMVPEEMIESDFKKALEQ